MNGHRERKINGSFVVTPPRMANRWDLYLKSTGLLFHPGSLRRLQGLLKHKSVLTSWYRLSVPDNTTTQVRRRSSQVAGIGC